MSNYQRRQPLDQITYSSCIFCIRFARGTRLQDMHSKVNANQVVRSTKYNGIVLARRSAIIATALGASGLLATRSRAGKRIQRALHCRLRHCVSGVGHRYGQLSELWQDSQDRAERRDYTWSDPTLLCTGVAGLHFYEKFQAYLPHMMQSQHKLPVLLRNKRVAFAFFMVNLYVWTERRRLALLKQHMYGLLHMWRRQQQCMPFHLPPCRSHGCNSQVI
ncbi:hypothetical protein ABBQ38_010754 [Trebouxia sp. C0009 RCD-2024]